MIDLVRAGRTPEELAEKFEPTAQTIRNWVAQADRDEGKRHDGLTSTEREELTRLRRENRQLKLEREILSKAAAWFARETGSIPDKGDLVNFSLRVCAQHGRELMGCKSPVGVPTWTHRVAKDNHEPKARARPRGLVRRKPECKRCEATDRNRIVKAEGCCWRAGT